MELPHAGATAPLGLDSPGVRPPSSGQPPPTPLPPRLGERARLITKGVDVGLRRLGGHDEQGPRQPPTSDGRGTAFSPARCAMSLTTRARLEPPEPGAGRVDLVARMPNVGAEATTPPNAIMLLLRPGRSQEGPAITSPAEPEAVIRAANARRAHETGLGRAHELTPARSPTPRDPLTDGQPKPASSPYVVYEAIATGQLTALDLVRLHAVIHGKVAIGEEAGALPTERLRETRARRPRSGRAPGDGLRAKVLDRPAPPMPVIRPVGVRGPHLTPAYMLQLVDGDEPRAQRGPPLPATRLARPCRPERPLDVSVKPVPPPATHTAEPVRDGHPMASRPPVADPVLEGALRVGPKALQAARLPRTRDRPPRQVPRRRRRTSDGALPRPQQDVVATEDLIGVARPELVLVVTRPALTLARPLVTPPRWRHDELQRLRPGPMLPQERKLQQVRAAGLLGFIILPEGPPAKLTTFAPPVLSAPDAVQGRRTRWRSGMARAGAGPRFVEGAATLAEGRQLERVGPAMRPVQPIRGLRRSTATLRHAGRPHTRP